MQLLVLALLLGSTVHSYPTYSVNPGVGAIYKGPNSETIVEGPDGSKITAVAEGGEIITGPETPGIVAETKPIAAHPVESAHAESRIIGADLGPIDIQPISSPLTEWKSQPIIVEENAPIITHRIGEVASVPVAHVEQPIAPEIHVPVAVEEDEDTVNIEGPSGTISTSGRKAIIAGPASTTFSGPGGTAEISNDVISYSKVEAAPVAVANVAIANSHDVNAAVNQHIAIDAVAKQAAAVANQQIINEAAAHHAVSAAANQQLINEAVAHNAVAAANQQLINEAAAQHAASAAVNQQLINEAAAQNAIAASNQQLLNQAAAQQAVSAAANQQLINEAAAQHAVAENNQRLANEAAANQHLINEAVAQQVAANANQHLINEETVRQSAVNTNQQWINGVAAQQSAANVEQHLINEEAFRQAAVAANQQHLINEAAARQAANERLINEAAQKEAAILSQQQYIQEEAAIRRTSAQNFGHRSNEALAREALALDIGRRVEAAAIEDARRQIILENSASREAALAQNQRNQILAHEQQLITEQQALAAARAGHINESSHVANGAVWAPATYLQAPTDSLSLKLTPNTANLLEVDTNKIRFYRDTKESTIGAKKEEIKEETSTKISEEKQPLIHNHTTEKQQETTVKDVQPDATEKIVKPETTEKIIKEDAQKVMDLKDEKKDEENNNKSALVE